MTKPSEMLVNIPYVIINDGECHHAAYSLGVLEQKAHEGTITPSEALHRLTLERAILDYQVSKAFIIVHGNAPTFTKL